MVKKLLLAIISLLFFKAEAQPYGASNFTLCSVISPETNLNAYNDKYSSCWGWYQASKNKEYAIAGSTSGTYWIDVTNPYTPTVSAFRAGKITTSVWREMKTYQNYCYVVSDDGGPNSFQIFDMQYLPDSVHKVYDGVGLFKRAHTVWVDGNKLYACGVTYSTGATSSMNLYSLATPTSPVLLRKLSQDIPFISYVHDAYVLNDTIFASCGNQGLYVFTYNSNNTFSQIGSLTSYPSSGYNHASALTPNRKTLVFTDEVPAGLPLKVADVQNINNIQVLSTINQYTAGTPHNPFIVNDSLCFMASYCDGLQLFNIKNPAAPFLAGYFDTFYQGGGNTSVYADDYDGLWSLYPYFPSKNIFALDEANGVFMLKSHLFSNPPPPNSGDSNIPTSGSVGTSTGSVATGIQENFNAASIRINPNPASDKVRFTIPAELMNKPMLVELIDIKGQIIFKQNTSDMKTGGTNYKEVNLSTYENGIYFFRLSMENTVIKNSKLIIAR